MTTIKTNKDLADVLSLPGAIAWFDPNKGDQFYAGQPGGEHALVELDSEAFESMNEIVGGKSVVAFVPDQTILSEFRERYGNPT